MGNLALKSYRVKMGLRQRDVANILSISAKLYSAKENNLTDFSLKEMIQLSRKFNASMQELFN